MKRHLIALIIAALVMTVFAGAPARAAGFTAWTLQPVASGCATDFDGDGETETFTVTAALDQWNYGSVTLRVGEAEITRENVDNMAETFYMLPVGAAGYAAGQASIYGTIFMISEYGPSDDHYTYCCLYADGRLTDVGGIPALPGRMKTGPDGVISTWVRARMIGTWERPAEYVLARGYRWTEEDFNIYYHLCEVPAGYYPYGMIVSLKTDLALRESPFDESPALTLRPEDSERVILAATDDARWLYVTDMSGEAAGWVRMGREDYATVIYQSGGAVDVNDVFGDILYAD